MVASGDPLPRSPGDAARAAARTEMHSFRGRDQNRAHPCATVYHHHADHSGFGREKRSPLGRRRCRDAIGKRLISCFGPAEQGCKGFRLMTPLRAFTASFCMSTLLRCLRTEWPRISYVSDKLFMSPARPPPCEGRARGPSLVPCPKAGSRFKIQIHPCFWCDLFHIDAGFGTFCRQRIKCTPHGS